MEQNIKVGTTRENDSFINATGPDIPIERDSMDVNAGNLNQIKNQDSIDYVSQLQDFFSEQVDKTNINFNEGIFEGVKFKNGNPTAQEILDVIREKLSPENLACLADMVKDLNKLFSINETYNFFSGTNIVERWNVVLSDKYLTINFNSAENIVEIIYPKQILHHDHISENWYKCSLPYARMNQVFELCKNRNELRAFFDEIRNLN